MKIFAACALLLLASAAGSAEYAPAVPLADGVLGYWSTDGGAVLHIANCSTGVCVTVVTISSKAPGVIDGRNPDPALRTRPICKMDIGTGFKLKDADHGEGGRIYDPESGKTYRSVMASDGNTLTLRGYVGFKAIGRSQTWKRTSAESSTCVGTTHR